MPNTVVKKGTVIRHSIVGWNAKIGENVQIGTDQSKVKEKEIAVVGPFKNIKDKSVIKAGEMV